MNKNKFNIQCHCGNISIDLITDLKIDELPRRKCQCGFCVSHGAVWTSDPESGEVEVNIKDKSKINKYALKEVPLGYRFGTKTADFYICKICGVAPIAISKINGNDNTVVNINTITKPKIDVATITKTNFAGESVDKRLKRRGNNWTKKVRVN